MKQKLYCSLFSVFLLNLSNFSYAKTESIEDRIVACIEKDQTPYRYFSVFFDPFDQSQSQDLGKKYENLLKLQALLQEWAQKEKLSPKDMAFLNWYGLISADEDFFMEWKASLQNYTKKKEAELKNNLIVKLAKKQAESVDLDNDVEDKTKDIFNYIAYLMAQKSNRKASYFLEEVWNEYNKMMQS